MLFTILLFLSFVIAPAPPPSYPVRIVFVEPAALNEREHAPLRGEVMAALAYWHAAPCAPSFPVVSEAAVTIPDAHTRADWLNDLAAPGVITIAVVTTPGPVDLGGYTAYGYHREWGDHVLFVAVGGDGVSGMDAILAHELGHAFGLPHITGAQPKDIMEYPHPAFYDGYLSAADVAAVCGAPPVQDLWRA